jgi:DUF1009 family protein
MESDVLGLIAGQGLFPLEIARAARRRGMRVAALAFHGETTEALEAAVESAHWLYPGEIAAAVEFLRSAGVREVVMAGKVPKGDLVGGTGELRLDAEGRRLVASLRTRGDHAILERVAEHLASHGIALREQTHFCPELLAEAGVLGHIEIADRMADDIALGVETARVVAGRDVGQTVVVKDGAVLAVEAIEGTDAAIRRGGSFAPGSCVVKVARRDQDPRFDLPAIGPETIRALIDARCAALAVEAGRAVVLERETAMALADTHGIAVVGISPGLSGAGS